ncbi:MAG TPA: NAD(P) transhydrogenase subunit alpha, partial [Pirellulales bacterium]
AELRRQPQRSAVTNHRTPTETRNMGTDRIRSTTMSNDPMTAFLQMYVFVLAGFVGFQVITRVPPLLHTPLMSATNAISGISLVGSLIMAGRGSHEMVSTALGFVAVTAAMINVVGGFMITDRMLKMFRKQEHKPKS